MKVGNDIYYVGVNDHQVDLFEGQYACTEWYGLQLLCNHGREDCSNGYGRCEFCRRMAW